MPLILPNTIANEQDADGDKLQQNFATIQSWGNQDAITADGSTGMLAPLLLPGAPTQPNQAATKAYADLAGANSVLNGVAASGSLLVQAGSVPSVLTSSNGAVLISFSPFKTVPVVVVTNAIQGLAINFAVFGVAVDQCQVLARFAWTGDAVASASVAFNWIAVGLRP